MKSRLGSSSRLIELVQYGGVAVVGLTIDLFVAWRLSVFGLNLTLAAGAGFVIAGLFNYYLNTIWTFRGAHKLSSSGAKRFVMISGVALVLRLSVVGVLNMMIASPSYDLIILISAVSASFLFSFVASRALVFRPPTRVTSKS